MAQATSELSGLREHSQNVKFNSRCESPSSNQVSTTPRTLLRSNVLQDGIEHIIYYLHRIIWEDAWKSYNVVTPRANRGGTHEHFHCSLPPPHSRLTPPVPTHNLPPPLL